MATKQFTTGQLIRRSLTPSLVSGVLCLTIGFMITVAHIILLSVSFGTALPGILDGQWSVAYTRNVVEPLTAFFTNATFNKLTVAALWGVVGLTAYLGFEYGMHTYKVMKDAQKEVALNSYGSYEERPMQQYFVRAMIWRASILVTAIVFFVAVQPLLRHAMDIAPQVVASRSLSQDGPKVLSAIVIWTLFCHSCVVLLRLYTTRTRIFGDEKLY